MHLKDLPPLYTDVTPLPMAPGNSLRDYFAAAAFATAAESHDWSADWITRAAATAYRIADAMIQERAKPKA